MSSLCMWSMSSVTLELRDRLLALYRGRVVVRSEGRVLG